MNCLGQYEAGRGSSFTNPGSLHDARVPDWERSGRFRFFR